MEKIKADLRCPERQTKTEAIHQTITVAAGEAEENCPQVSKIWAKSKIFGQRKETSWSKPEFFGQQQKKFGRNQEF